MSCGQDHFEPISSKVNPNYPDPPPGYLGLTPPAKPRGSRHSNWGGRRKGAGAPKGNLNAFRHGRYSARHRDLALLLAQIPEASDSLIKLAARKRKIEDGASVLMGEVLRRLGEALLDPQADLETNKIEGDNHLEHNQELAASIHQLASVLREMQKRKSR